MRDDDDVDDNDKQMYFNVAKVLKLQGHVTITARSHGSQRSCKIRQKV